MNPRRKVALLVETSNTYAREVLHGIHSYQRERETWSMYLTEHGRGEILTDWLKSWKGDGIIARVVNEKIYRDILQTKLPAVDMSLGLEHSTFPRVVTDSLAATRLAAEHLLERGFTNFGYCGESRYHWSRLQSDLFAGQIRTAGHKCATFESMGNYSRGDGWETELDAIAKWLQKLPKPVGIMACYDIRGQQVLEACRRLNIAVPDEVAVIGVHNDELLCELCDPPLSSVIPNARRAGYEAAALLDRMMRGEKIPPQRVLLAPIGIATRQSTDVVAVSDPQLSQVVRYIREHACEGIDVGDVLKAVPMSRTSLERRFKQLLARTPLDHILRVRINHAKALLTTTDLPIALISERTGFEHVEYFSVAFKRIVGDTPGRFRTLNQT
jgi:LacI family transcriptional regulator